MAISVLNEATRSFPVQEQCLEGVASLQYYFIRLAPRTFNTLMGIRTFSCLTPIKAYFNSHQEDYTLSKGVLWTRTPLWVL